MAYRSGCIPVGACAFGAEGRMALCCRTGQRLRRCRSGGKGLGRRFQKEGAPVWIKPLQPGFARGKQANRPSGVGNAPLLPTAPLHGKASHEIFSRLMVPYKFRSLATPEGEVLAALCLVMLMSSEGKRRADFPLRGRCRRRQQKGCISDGRQPGWPVFQRPPGRLHGFIIRGALYE